MIRVTVFADHDLKHPLAGGANVNLEENLKRLASRFEIRLLCGWSPGLRREETCAGVRIIRFPGNPLSLRAKIPLWYKENLEDRTDVVWDEVDFSVPWMTPLFTRKPVLLHCLHLQKGNFFLELPWWKAAPAYCLEPWLYKLYRGRRVLSISPSTRASLLELGFPAESLDMVPPGLDPAVLAGGRGAFEHKPDRPVIAALSRLRAWKGVHFAVAAMKDILPKVPDAELRIIGTGPYEPELRALVRDLDIEPSVKFLGRLSEEEKLAELARAHILTKTSGREGWGIDVLEANANFTPAVGWDVPGTRDSIRNGRTGTLVPFGDVAGLAREAVRLLTDAPLRRKLASAAYEYSAGLTWDKSSEAIARILEGMAGGAGRG